MTNRKRRVKLYADHKLQGALLVHATIYWFYCLFSVTLIAVCWIIFTKQPESSTELFTMLWLNCGPALLGSVVLLPLVLLDCLRLSSRFAGPMVRMQRVMRDLAAGESPPPVQLRPGDFWTEFADNVNLVMDRLRQQETPLQASHPASSTVHNNSSDEPAASDTDARPNSPPAFPTDPPSDNARGTQNIYSDLSI